MGLKEPSNNGLPPKSNGVTNKPENKLRVVNFDFDNRPNKLNESGRTTQATSESTSSADEPDTQQQQQHDNSESCNGVGPLHQQYDTRSLHTHLSNELTSLHSSTHQAIQMSYTEQEHLSSDINTMQSRISYLKRKIGLARKELIAKGGADMGDELLRLSLVKEVDSVDMTDDDEGGGGGNSEKNNFEVTYESFKSSSGNLISNKIGSSSSNNTSRRGLLTQMGSQNSGLSSGPSSHDESDVVSGSSIFRITFGGADGMPSRWRAREELAQKNSSNSLAKDGVKDDSKDECLSNSIAGDDMDDDFVGDKDDGAVTENTKEQQLITLKQLVNDRESEISFLEKEMMTVEKEKSSLENEVSMMTRNMEQSKTESTNEREKLVGAIELCQLDNSRLERELMKTTVSLGVNKMNIELLGNELREARNMFIKIQMRKEREKYERRRRQRIDNESSVPQSNKPLRVASYEMPMNDKEAYQDAGERKPGSARNTTSLSNSAVSMESAVTMMSALTTSDFSDSVDVLEGIGSTSSR
eukprot:scaffold4515_cov124-Skeletonema_dohrnii-CCMP3373.AAC.5